MMKPYMHTFTLEYRFNGEPCTHSLQLEQNVTPDMTPSGVISQNLFDEHYVCSRSYSLTVISSRWFQNV